MFKAKSLSDGNAHEQTIILSNLVPRAFPFSWAVICRSRCRLLGNEKKEKMHRMRNVVHRAKYFIEMCGSRKYAYPPSGWSLEILKVLKTNIFLRKV